MPSTAKSRASRTRRFSTRIRSNSNVTLKDDMSENMNKNIKHLVNQVMDDKENTCNQAKVKAHSVNAPKTPPLGNAIQRATPYHEVISESGRRMSPRLTRSTTKKKKRKELMDADNQMNLAKSGVKSSGNTLLVFSPPSKRHVEEHERKLKAWQDAQEQEFQDRISKLRRTNFLDISPPNKRKKEKLESGKTLKKDKMFYLEFSPGGTYMGDPSKLELCLSHTELNAAFLELREAYNNTVENMKSLKEQLSNRDAKINDLEQELGNNRQNHEEEIQQINERFIVLKQKHDSEIKKLCKNDEIHKNLDNPNDQFKAIQEELLQKTKDELREDYKDSFNITVKTLGENLENSKLEIKSLKEKVNQTNEIEKELIQKVAQVDMLTIEIEKAYNMVKEKDAEIIALSKATNDNKVETTNAMIADARFDNILTAIETNAGRQNTLKEMELKLVNLEAKYQKVKNQNEDFMKRNENQLKKEESLEESLQEYKSQIETLINEKDHLAKELKGVQSECLSLREEYNSMEEKLSLECNELRTELNHSLENQKSGREIFESSKQEYTDLKRSNDKFQTEV